VNTPGSSGHEDRIHDRAGLHEHQLGRLRRLLHDIHPGNLFQTARLESAGVDARIGSPAEFSRRLPLLTKAELMADQLAHPPYGTNLTFPLDQYTRFHQTSGTTGHALRWLDTPASWDRMVDGWTRVLAAAGTQASDRVVFAFTFGPFIGFWMAFEAAQRLGCLCLPAGGLSSLSRLRLILDNAATVLCCTPTYAARLAEVAAGEHIDLAQSKVRLLIVAGEPGGSIPAVRRQLSQLWPGARVFDHHGMTEVGPVTYECPAQTGCLHVLEASFLAEVIDPASGTPSAAGQPGELVLTTLVRTGSPVLRYRTGDLVLPRFSPADQSVAPCACGSQELALEGGILGRVDDMVIVRGVNVHPAAVDGIVRDCGGVTEYQVEVFATPTLTELSLRLEAAPDAGEPGEVARRVQKTLQTRLNLRIPVAAVPAGSLPRFEMKARRWIRSQPPSSNG
jgi:phenylacetate-CoA ligase